MSDEKMPARDGEDYRAIVEARHGEHDRRAECEHVHLMLLSEVRLGLDDVEDGLEASVDELRAKYGR